MSDTIEQLSAKPDAELDRLAAKCMGWSNEQLRDILDYSSWRPSDDIEAAFELQAKAIERDARAYIDALANSPDRATNRLKP